MLYYQVKNMKVMKLYTSENNKYLFLKKKTTTKNTFLFTFLNTCILCREDGL